MFFEFFFAIEKDAHRLFFSEDARGLFFSEDAL